MKVLIAEDEAVPRVILQAALRRGGHECVVATDGDEAWRLFVSDAPEVVISDWQMPGGNGLELCRRIRERPGSAYPYFIFLTALEEQGHVVEAMQAGADDFLMKPLNPVALEAALIAASRLTALHRQVSEHQAELERLSQRVHDEARRDPITRLGNRLRLSEDVEALWASLRHDPRPATAALLDLDHFKRYNDEYGHVAGDRALADVAGVLAGGIKAPASVYRYGGEEFLVLLPGHAMASALAVIDGLRRNVEALAIDHRGNLPAGVVTVSAGVAQLRSEAIGTLESWLRIADSALYTAKERGRNSVVAAGTADRAA